MPSSTELASTNSSHTKKQHELLITSSFSSPSSDSDSTAASTMSGVPTLKMSPVAPSSSQIISGNQRMTILADGLLRLETTPDGKFEDRASTFAINRDLPTPKFDVVKQEGGGMEIVTDRLFIQWSGEAFSPSSLLVSLRKKGGGNMGWTHIWRYGDKNNMQWTNLGGTYRTLDEVDGRCQLDTGILSQYGLAVLDDSETMLFTEDGWITGRDANKSDVYLFAYGLNYREALKTFFTVSGPPPLIPRWSLGNWWSRYYAYTDKEYLGLMDRFRKNDMPLSVAVIDIDWHLIDVPEEFGTGWTGYTWNKELFPDHVAFLKGLHDRKLKTTLNTHPADGVRAFEKPYEAMCKALGRDSSKGVPIPFECADKKFFTEYLKQLHHPLEDEGCDFWWLDWQQGPHSEVKGVDPLWVLNHYHFLDSGRKDDRRFTFSRYAGPGSHRYPIGFSGDTVMTWASLEFQPEFTATAANIGYGQWSHDIGGHMNGIKDNELMARWVQLGCFSPILRLHSSDSPFNTREPWAFSRECQDVCAKFLQFRHRLVPYIYSINARASESYQSLVEPVYYDYADRSEAYAHKTQFTFGTELLVIPIVTPSDKSTRLGKGTGWLPPGRWVDVFNGVVYDGDRTLSFYRTLDDYPVLAKEGAIIPLDGNTGGEIENGCPTPEHIEILLFQGKDGEFTLVEDDGSGAEISTVKFSKTPIKYSQSNGTLTIGPTENPLLKERTYTVRLLAGSAKGSSISVDGSAVNAESTDPDSDSIISLGKQSTSATITITFQADSSVVKADHKDKIYERLNQAQMGIDPKLEIWNAVKAIDKEGALRVISRLNAIDAQEELKGAVLELLMAA